MQQQKNNNGVNDQNITYLGSVQSILTFKNERENIFFKSFVCLFLYIYGLNRRIFDFVAWSLEMKKKLVVRVGCHKNKFCQHRLFELIAHVIDNAYAIFGETEI